MKSPNTHICLQFSVDFYTDETRPGISKIVAELLTNGSVLTANTAVSLLGYGGFANFVKCKPYNVHGVYQWTLNDSFWNTEIWNDYLKAFVKKLTNEQTDLSDRIKEIDQIMHEISQ